MGSRLCYSESTEMRCLGLWLADPVPGQCFWQRVKQSFSGDVLLLCYLCFDTKEYITFLDIDVKFLMAGSCQTSVVLMAYTVFSSADSQVTRGCNVSKIDLRFALNRSVAKHFSDHLWSFCSLHLFQTYSRTACKSETRCWKTSCKTETSLGKNIPWSGCGISLWKKWAGYWFRWTT